MNGHDLLAWLAGPAVMEKRLSRETATNYSTAVRTVLAASPSGLDTALDDLDLDAAGDRFRETNGNSTKRSAETIANYISAFKAAVRGFTGSQRRLTERNATRAPAAKERLELPLGGARSVEVLLPGDLNTDEAELVAEAVRLLARRLRSSTDIEPGTTRVP